jgi:hypothetical protein
MPISIESLLIDCEDEEEAEEVKRLFNDPKNQTLPPLSVLAAHHAIKLHQ